MFDKFRSKQETNSLKKMKEKFPQKKKNDYSLMRLYFSL